MNLPSEFFSTIHNTFREEGDAFLKALPSSISEASAKWGLTNVVPSPLLSYNFVAFADRASTADFDGTSQPSAQRGVVLKMGVPNKEFLSELEALRLFNGEGACRLLEFDEEKYWMLLERLKPGEMLATMKDDEEATRIAAEVMKKIWKNLEVRELAPEQPTASCWTPEIHPAYRLVRWIETIAKDV